MCERLKQALDEATYIPEEKLSGEFRGALKELQEFQKNVLKEIVNKIVIIAERE